MCADKRGGKNQSDEGLLMVAMPEGPLGYQGNFITFPHCHESPMIHPGNICPLPLLPATQPTFPIYSKILTVSSMQWVAQGLHQSHTIA